MTTGKTSHSRSRGRMARDSASGRHRSGLAVIVLLLFSSSMARCALAKSPVEAMQMRETTDGRPMAEAAAAKASAILSTSDYGIAGSWQAVPGNGERKTIRLYLVAATSPAFMVMVPYDCDCIFVQPGDVATWIDRYSKRSAAMKAISAIDALAFMLLHEVGHIAHGDAGHLQEDESGPVYNIDETEQKARESAADRFAADALNEAFQPGSNVKGFSGSFDVELALTNLSWNLSVIRHLINFGATPLCSKFAFADDGFTHPNFELRILTVNALISMSEASNELLASFETCRHPPSVTVRFKDISRKD